MTLLASLAEVRLWPSIASTASSTIVVVAEYAAGETLHGLSKRHDICRNLIRVWVAKSEAGAFDDEIEASNLLTDYEGRIAALERLV